MSRTFTTTQANILRQLRGEGWRTAEDLANEQGARSRAGISKALWNLRIALLVEAERIDPPGTPYARWRYRITEAGEECIS